MTETLSEAERVFAYRMSAFLRLGFSATQSEEMAGSSVDLHQAERTLAGAVKQKQAKPHKLVFELLMPV